jgi:penicillin-binding protein 1C
VEWPSSIRRWLRDQDRALPAPPELLAGCAPGGARRAPSILSPAPGQVALLVAGVAPDRQAISFEAETAAEGRLAWFVDGQYLGAAGSDERVWWTPQLGRHEVIVTDEAGLSARRVLEVRPRAR